ncbi:MAG: hypothetical protein ACBR12_10045 [Microcoleus sp.]
MSINVVIGNALYGRMAIRPYGPYNTIFLPNALYGRMAIRPYGPYNTYKCVTAYFIKAAPRL